MWTEFKEQLDKSSALRWGLLLLGVLIAEVIATVAIPEFRKVLFDALELKQAGPFYSAIGMYACLALGLGAVQGIKTWLCHRTGLVFREAIVQALSLKRRIKKITDHVATPCARINNDSFVATDMFIQVFSEVFISAAITVGLIYTMRDNPVLLAWALGYSVLTFGVALLFRKPLMTTKDVVLTAEGEHRKSLIVKDDYAESMWRFSKVKEAYLSYVKTLRNYTLYSRVQNGLAGIVPYLILAPLFLSGKFSLGDMMSQVAQFDLLVINLTIMVSLYSQVIEAQVSWVRIKELWNSLVS